MRKFRALIILLCAVATTTAYASPADSVQLQQNISELANYFEGKGYAINQMLQDNRFKLIEGITEKFTRSAEVKIEGFEQYQKAVGFDRKKTIVADFMKEYGDELIAAEKEYDISRYVIAGIIGIESEFGKYKGSYNPFNAYVSMYAEGYRSDFAKAQLEELLIFTNEHNLDVLSLESSYAGAMSYAQFIPYSLNRWFVGSELYNMKNNIASVANYLAHFKEITGSTEKAIYRYNPSSLYTQAVLALAEEARQVDQD
ncbi:lytic murein transglycosylase [Gracilimonas mengyeensis]|uniref:Transglycosylase SLT domain-containing protein n=1 Tax=Gracilimonas mengyeensis TaxID=1302730 RepID=A0A521E347_9BACT|nr:lytic murein transglycosylase [Gracilimonas mengyeensis]SMO77761.1 Transglycosylase SLT domain-containing protein [Gracilimonas mengyeensis]